MKVGSNVEAVFHDHAFEQGRKVLGHGNGRRVFSKVLQVQIGLLERSRNADYEPAAIRGEADSRPVLLHGRTMYQAILRRIGTEPVKEQSTMIMLLAFRDLTRRRVAGVIESAAVRKPRNIGRARVWNAVRKLLPGRHVHYVQDALFVAVFGQSVGE